MYRILLILLVVSNISYAQSKEVTFGIKGGVNLSSFNTSIGPNNPEMNIGVSVGGIWEIPLNRTFVLQPEALYSLEVLNLGVQESEGNLYASYLRIPILAKMYIFQGWGLEAGPTTGLLISAKRNDYNVKENFYPLDVALTVGTSYRMKKGFIIGARYNMGVTNIAKIPAFGKESKINGFLFSVGYFL